jgi:hypothetical protein
LARFSVFGSVVVGGVPLVSLVSLGLSASSACPAIVRRPLVASVGLDFACLIVAGLLARFVELLD